MRIPKVINRGNNVYIFVKEYSNFFLYKDMKTGVNECFKKTDLVQIKQYKKCGVSSKWDRD